MEQLGRWIELKENAAIRARQRDCPSRDRAQNGLDVKRRADGLAHFELSGTEKRREIGAGPTSWRLEDVELPRGPGKLRAWVERPKEMVGVYQVELRRRD